MSQTGADTQDKTYRKLPTNPSSTHGGWHSFGGVGIGECLSRNKMRKCFRVTLCSFSNVVWRITSIISSDFVPPGDSFGGGGGHDRRTRPRLKYYWPDYIWLGLWSRTKLWVIIQIALYSFWVLPLEKLIIPTASITCTGFWILLSCLALIVPLILLLPVDLEQGTEGRY